jgi:hypothetical protein
MRRGSLLSPPSALTALLATHRVPAHHRGMRQSICETDTLRRLAELFRSGFFDKLTAAAFLQPTCLICGKALTDPAPMALLNDHLRR